MQSLHDWEAYVTVSCSTTCKNISQHEYHRAVRTEMESQASSHNQQNTN